MGQLFEAKCGSCQYSASGPVGGTRSNFNEYDPFPALCNKCRTITLINRRKKPFACQKCKNEDVIEYGYRTLESLTEPSHLNETELRFWQITQQSSWSDGLHLCPKCEKYELRFTSRRMFFD